MSKGLAILFIVLLVTQTLAAPVQNKPIKKTKGIQINNVLNKAKREVPVQDKQLYVQSKKSAHKKKKLSACLCNNGSNQSQKTIVLSHHSGSIRNVNRTFETIGTCLTSVNKIRLTQRSVDFVVTEPFSFETVTTYLTCMKELGATTEKRHFKLSRTICIQRLTTMTATIQVIVPISVTVEALTSVSTFVDTITNTKACVQTLTSISKMQRKLTSEKVCAKRLTSASASIQALKTIHEVIKQRVARTVKCSKAQNSVSRKSFATSISSRFESKSGSGSCNNSGGNFLQSNNCNNNSGGNNNSAGNNNSVGNNNSAGGN